MLFRTCSRVVVSTAGRAAPGAGPRIRYRGVAGIGPLEKIKHIVVLMMENRSFDHMLGYLRNDGMPEVRGLAGDESNLDSANTEHRVYEYPPEPFPDSFDPCHAPECVAEQLDGGNGGFIRNFEEWMTTKKVTPAPDPGYVMGHY